MTGNGENSPAWFQDAARLSQLTFGASPSSKDFKIVSFTTWFLKIDTHIIYTDAGGAAFKGG
jgi:hypothetical protein